MIIIQLCVVELVGFQVGLNSGESKPRMIRRIRDLIACHCERGAESTGLVIRLDSDQARKNVDVIQSTRMHFHVKIRRSAIATIPGSTIVYVARTVYTVSLGQTGGDRNETDGRCFRLGVPIFQIPVMGRGAFSSPPQISPSARGKSPEERKHLDGILDSRLVFASHKRRHSSLRKVY